MNDLIRKRSLTVLFALICLLISPLSAQMKAVDTWDVLGSYSCSLWGSDAPPAKLFLLPNGRWNRVAPFEFSFSNLTWISVRTRNVQFNLPYSFNLDGMFTVESGVIKLYNLEFLDLPSGPQNGLVQNYRWKAPFQIERPAALPPERPAGQAMILVETFNFDPSSGQLTEVLPLDSIQQPLRCQQKPLFTDTTF